MAKQMDILDYAGLGALAIEFSFLAAVIAAGALKQKSWESA